MLYRGSAAPAGGVVPEQPDDRFAEQIDVYGLGDVELKACGYGPFAVFVARESGERHRGHRAAAYGIACPDLLDE